MRFAVTWIFPPGRVRARPSAFFKLPDDLGYDAAVNVFSFRRVWHDFVLLKTFLRETHDDLLHARLRYEELRYGVS